MKKIAMGRILRWGGGSLQLCQSLVNGLYIDSDYVDFNKDKIYPD